MTTRRDFIRAGIGALGAVSVASGLTPRAIDAGAAAKQKLSHIGLQLYTMRNEMAKDFRGTLERVAAVGFDEVEFAGYYDKSPTEVRTILHDLKLEAPAAHVPLAALRDAWTAALDTASEIGHDYVVLAWLAPEERTSLESYRKLADLLNTRGEEAKKHDLQLVYHNHDFEFAPIDGALPYDLLLEKTDSKLVQLELDLYWIAKAGHDPIAYFMKYPGRFPLLHVKDMTKTPEHAFTEVGRGQIDFAKIFAASKLSGARHYFVEQDVTPGPPLESIKISYDYLEKLKY
jgi:sugar phosphate isomerase/epimerase